MSDYRNELKLPNRILLGPGPSNVHPRVLQAMLAPMLGHLDPDFWPVLDHVRDMLRRVLGTTHPWTLPLSATGTAGMEAAFCNVVEPGSASSSSSTASLEGAWWRSPRAVGQPCSAS